jgi:uncharacterized protein YPO0396
VSERLTRKDIAAHFDVSPQRIGQLVSEGRLKEDRGTIDLAEATAVFDEMDPEYKARIAAQKQARLQQDNVTKIFNTARARKEAAKAQQAELDLKVAQKRFVDRGLVEQQHYAAFKLAHTKLTMIPRQMAPQLAIETDPAAIEQALTAVIDAAIAEIRNGLAELGSPDAA